MLENAGQSIAAVKISKIWIPCKIDKLVAKNKCRKLAIDGLFKLIIQMAQMIWKNARFYAEKQNNLVEALAKIENALA